MKGKLQDIFSYIFFVETASTMPKCWCSSLVLFRFVSFLFSELMGLYQLGVLEICTTDVLHVNRGSLYL